LPQLEGAFFEGDFPASIFGKIENVIDDLQEHFAAALNGADIVALRLREPGMERMPVMPMTPFSGVRISGSSRREIHSLACFRTPVPVCVNSCS